MEQKQADAIAQTVIALNRDPVHQEELRRKRAQEEKFIARRRVVAWLTLAGCGIGGLVAALTPIRFGTCVLYGGLAGGALGWMIVALRRSHD